MTAKQSTARLLIYAFIAALTPVASEFGNMTDANPFQWVGLIIQALLSAAIAVRAYIDTTPSQVTDA